MDISAIEEVTPVYVKDLTREQAQELYQEYNILQSKIRTVMEILKEKTWSGTPKIQEKGRCERCSSTNIRPRVNGTYFCANCGFRTVIVGKESGK